MPHHLFMPAGPLGVLPCRPPPAGCADQRSAFPCLRVALHGGVGAETGTAGRRPAKPACRPTRADGARQRPVAVKMQLRAGTPNLPDGAGRRGAPTGRTGPTSGRHARERETCADDVEFCRRECRTTFSCRRANSGSRSWRRRLNLAQIPHLAEQRVQPGEQRQPVRPYLRILSHDQHIVEEGVHPGREPRDPRERRVVAAGR